VGRINTLDYAMMANRVYDIDMGVADNYVVPGYETRLFEEGMRWGAINTDFKGCVYVDTVIREVVVAFQGTKPRKAGDIASDVQIMIGMLPQYTTAAMRLLDRTMAVFPDYAISLVGHSLGGGMAQVIGHWTGCPFVTFNAPGMWGDIQKAKLAFWFPRDWVRSLRGTFKGSLFSKQMATTGRNFRNVMDPVSAYGCHYGPVTRFWGCGLHSMNDVEERIRTSRWAAVNPFDARYKEWGEF
jgi:hypothetical protein